MRRVAGSSRREERRLVAFIAADGWFGWVGLGWCEKSSRSRGAALMKLQCDDDGDELQW